MPNPHAAPHPHTAPHRGAQYVSSTNLGTRMASAPQRSRSRDRQQSFLQFHCRWLFRFMNCPRSLDRARQTHHRRLRRYARVDMCVMSMDEVRGIVRSLVRMRKSLLLLHRVISISSDLVIRATTALGWCLRSGCACRERLSVCMRSDCSRTQSQTVAGNLCTQTASVRTSSGDVRSTNVQTTQPNGKKAGGRPALGARAVQSGVERDRTASGHLHQP